MRPGDPSSVEKLFNEVAPKYDRLNDFLSLGLHRVWKRQLVHSVQPVAGEYWIDLCCGTGDLALALARVLRPSGRVLGIDSASEPLELATRRSAKQSWLDVSWMQGDALNTGLLSEQFDGAVMAFGLRNLSDPFQGLSELHRILKPGARAGILDFNKLPDGTAAERFQKFYLRKIVVPFASRADLKNHYAYLEESLKTFPDGAAQKLLAIKAGFSSALHRPIALGQMGVLLLQK